FEDEKRPADAAYFLTLYLKRVPSDTDARARLALLYVRLAHSVKELQSAFEGLESFLRRQPDRTDLRREAIHLAMSRELARYSDARFHLEYLLKEKPDAELELLLGQCWLAEKHFKEAAAHFAEAVKRAPKQLDGYVLHASVLREHLDGGSEADAVMDKLVDTVGSAAAHLVRANYRSRFGKPADATDDIEK